MSGAPSQLHPRDRLALKSQFRLLVQSVGGDDAASAALGGYPRSRISEAASPHHPDRWARIDHVAELEALAPQPFVTATLARLGGWSLLPIIGAAGNEGEAMGAVLGNAGELGNRTLRALADGQITEEERADLAEGLAVLARAVAHAQAVLAGRSAKLRSVG